MEIKIRFHFMTMVPVSMAIMVTSLLVVEQTMELMKMEHNLPLQPQQNLHPLKMSLQVSPA